MAVRSLLADGTDSLSYFTYEIWAGTRGRDASDAFDSFVSRPQAVQVARDHRLDIYRSEWIGGLEARTLAGEWSRKDGYVGYSDGFDHLPAKGAPYYRLPSHFIGNAIKPKSLNQHVLQEVRRFKATYPQHASKVFVFISIIGTAERLDEQLAHADVRPLPLAPLEHHSRCFRLSRRRSWSPKRSTPRLATRTAAAEVAARHRAATSAARQSRRQLTACPAT